MLFFLQTARICGWFASAGVIPMSGTPRFFGVFFCVCRVSKLDGSSAVDLCVLTVLPPKRRACFAILGKCFNVFQTGRRPDLAGFGEGGLRLFEN